MENVIASSPGNDEDDPTKFSTVSCWCLSCKWSKPYARSPVVDKSWIMLLFYYIFIIVSLWCRFLVVKPIEINYENTPTLIMGITHICVTVVVLIFEAIRK